MTFGQIFCSLQLLQTAEYLNKLVDPHNLAIGKHVKQSTGSVSITAENDGRYEYCFSNQMSSVADKIIRYLITTGKTQSLAYSFSLSFNVHGVVYVGEDGDEDYDCQ